MIDPAHFITNFIKLVQGSSSTGAFFALIGIVAYLLVSFFLSRIFSKAGQPAVAAFVPIWNVVTFFRLGGYSALWVIGSIIGGFYVISVSYLPIGRLTGSHFADSGFAKGMEHAAPLLMPIFGFIFIASSLIGLLAAYNIGRAFEKDGGYLLLFVFLYPVWTLALAFTSYDWDEYSANPNSVGVMNRTRIRKEQATELAANKAKSSRFLDPVAPDNIKREEPESDYDRALREQAARGGVPAQKKSRGKRSKKADPGDAKIVDSGSTGVSEDSGVDVMTNKVWVESPSWRDLDIGDRVLYVASPKAPNKTNSEFVVAHAFYDTIEQQPVLEDEDGKRLFYDGYYGNHGTLYVQREFATENTTD